MKINKDDIIFKKLDIEVNNIDIYRQAFTHASYQNEHRECQSYDRLEFLGDSILDMVIADMAYKKYPEFNSGNLSKVRSILVGGKRLTQLSEEIYHLDEYVMYSKGEENNTRFHHHINEDVFESFIAAIYLDQGFLKVVEVIHKIFENDLNSAEKELTFYDPKTTLQEKVSSNIDYVVTKRENLNSNDVSYTVEARLQGVALGEGIGHNIQEAEIEAAKDALLKKVGE